MADYTTVDPWIISADTDAEIEFLQHVFGATSRGEPVRNPDGRIGHAEVVIGDSVLMLFDFDETKPTHLRAFVDDIERVVAAAVEAGATLVTRPVEMFWGDVTARFRDPQGHLWWISQRQQLDPETIQERAANPTFAEAMAYAQSSGAEALRG